MKPPLPALSSDDKKVRLLDSPPETRPAASPTPSGSTHPGDMMSAVARSRQSRLNGRTGAPWRGEAAPVSLGDTEPLQLGKHFGDRPIRLVIARPIGFPVDAE